MPVGAAFIYVLVLVRRLPDVVDQLTWNADYVSVMALAQTIGPEGKTGHAIIVQIVYFWFDLAVLPLPFHKLLWLYAPYAMALVALLLLAWTASGGCGRFVALRTPARGLAASPLILSTQAADSYHGTTWFGAALLAAYLCWLLTSRPRLMTTVAVGVVVALLVGFATASDPLLAPTGDTPFAVALVLAWLVRRKQVETRALVTGLGGLAGARLVRVALSLTDRLLGYTSSFPRGLTHFVSPERVSLHVQQLAGGLFEVAGMPRGGSPLGVVLWGFLVARVGLPFSWIGVSVRGSMRASRLSVIAYWSASAVVLA